MLVEFLVLLVVQAVGSLGLPLHANYSNASNVSHVNQSAVVKMGAGFFWPQQETPFPQWLTEFTGLTEWPGFDPPYIPLDFIDVNKLPKYEPYSLDQCDRVPREACSFDCHSCLEPDDVYTCPKLSQTFDDGPSEETEALLGNLTHKTTFFTVGVNVVRHPNVYRRMVEEGHLIGTHTWSHPYLPTLSNEQIIAQLEWSIWAMNATGHHFPKYFRPPYGAIDNRIRAIARRFGLQAVLWDHDTFDWQLSVPSLRSTEDILRDVQEWKTGNGGLILEHDASPNTVEAASRVSELIGNDQLTVAECIGGIDYIKKYY